MAINKDLLASLNQKDKDIITEIMEDPLLWAEVTFPPKWAWTTWKDEHGQEFQEKEVIAGWHTRPWQQQILDKPGLRKVLRVNRRAGKSLVSLVKCLHKSFVQGKGALILTPFDRQAGELYKETHNRFIKYRPDIFTYKSENAVIVKDTRSPYIIEFSNGGFMNFITTGTKSGGKADAVRGQGGNVGIIFIDEMDLMGDDEMKSIMAIMAQNKAMEVIITSTPTGKRGLFWDLCVNTKNHPGWNSFHYTCWDTLPGWDVDRDRAMKSVLGPIGYQHEMLADFGEEVQGVFNKDTIDDAMERGVGAYPYKNLKGQDISINYPTYGYAEYAPANPDKYRVVGVDWDKYGAGTQIIITEADVVKNRTDKALEDPFSFVKVIHRTEIPKGKFTLVNAVKRLVEINREFSPDFFYLDAGFGEHQIETLVSMGMECKDPTEPQYGIHEKIVRVNFSAGVKVLDPHTRELINKPIKPEMVGRLRNKFDYGEMILNPYDLEIKTQLENYIVEKITSYGQPKYTSINEHMVDALMLSVWGLYVEFGDDLGPNSKLVFIDPAIGQRYEERMKYLQQQNIPHELISDAVKDDIKMAKMGYIRSEKFEEEKNSAIEKYLPASRMETFSRGGKFPSANRRRF